MLKIIYTYWKNGANRLAVCRVATNLQYVKNSIKKWLPVFTCLCFKFILYPFLLCFLLYLVKSLATLKAQTFTSPAKPSYLLHPKLISHIALQSYLARYFVIYVFIYLLLLDYDLLEGRSSLCSRV